MTLPLATFLTMHCPDVLLEPPERGHGPRCFLTEEMAPQRSRPVSRDGYVATEYVVLNTVSKKKQLILGGGQIAGEET